MTIPNAEERILVLAPLGRDAALTSAELRKSGLVAEICADLATLCAELQGGAGTVLLTAEALTPTAAQCLVATLNQQPPWSDLPLVILTSATAPQASQRIVEWLGPRANLTLLERPIRTLNLTSTLQAALRARRRQYEIRDHLVARAEVEAALRESEERLRVIWESAADAVALSDPNGIVLAANPAYFQLYGYPPEQVLGHSFALIFPEEERERAVEAYRETFNAPEITPRVESVARRADGAELVVEARYDFVVQAGRRVAMVSMVRDVSERRALERLQRDFLAMVTHELRTPLTSVKGYAQLLERRGTYSDRAVRAIREQADLLERLVGDLMEASQLEAGRLSLQLEPVELVAEVRAAVERFQPQTAIHTFRLQAPDRPLVGQWDRDRLGQVLANLLSNAIKYSPDGGEIRVQVEDSSDEARVAITDQGVGVPTEALPRLFDRFYRSRAAAGSTKGLGLGLYITKGIVEAHGGQIRADSRLGGGSTFSFSLPYRR